jgi:hypothetical protein
MVPNERLLLVESDLDRSIDLVFQAMQAKDAKQISDLIPVIGIAAVKKLYQLADDHSKYALSADIEWQRKGDTKKRVVVQPPEFDHLRAEISKKSEKTSETITLSGRLVGLDVEAEGEEISGKLAPAFSGADPARIPGNYIAMLTKETVIYYSTQEDKVTYQLGELRRR